MEHLVWIEDTSHLNEVPEILPLEDIEDSSVWDCLHDIARKIILIKQIKQDDSLGRHTNKVPVNENFQITVHNDATGKNPAQDNFSGCHKFDIKFDENKGGAAWNYSPVMDKLFIKMDTKIQMAFTYDAQQDDLFVRALPVFLDSNNFTKPVQRCYSHRNPQDTINQGYSTETDHIIRIDDQLASYQNNEDSGRFSVVVPLGPKQNGTEKIYKPLSFMCQNSCLGMKRPLAVIFTLEDQYCRVLGRRTLNVKVCSGPNRDRKLEERTSHQIRDKKTKKRKPDSTDSAEDNGNETSITVPNKILKLVVSYTELRLKELCEEENRKPDENEKQCLKQYTEILETLRQEKKPKTSQTS